MRPSLLAAAILMLSSAPRIAGANGRFPAAQHLVGGAGAASRSLAVRTTFGVLASDDRGATWRFLCEELLGVGFSTTWDAPIVVTGDGALLTGLTDGLTREVDGCTAPRNPEVGRDLSADLTITADGATVLWVGSTGAENNRLMASTDGGRTFSARGRVRDGVLLETVEVSDSDPSRVYATGVQVEPRAFVLFRSDDGGRTLTELPLAFPGITGAYLAGLEPGRADVIYIRAPLEPEAGPEGGTVLLRGTGGGARFEEVARTRGPMLGFAIRDGGTLWYGGPDDGLWRATAGGAPARVGAIPVNCLRWHDGALYACANHLRAGWAVGRSTDGGSSFEPVLRLDALAPPPRCASGTVGGDVCPGRWSVTQRALAPDAGVIPRDAGSSTPPPASGGTCASRPGRARTAGAGLALLGLALARRRRRAGAMLPRPCDDTRSR